MVSLIISYTHTLTSPYMKEKLFMCMNTETKAMDIFFLVTFPHSL
jgi:hypothetical protein